MCLSGLIAGLAGWLLLGDVVAARAHELAPPIYPGADKVSTAFSISEGIATEVVAYRVAAHVSRVQPWMDGQMPGFATCAAFTPINPNCSANIRCDASLLSQWSLRVLLGGDSHRVQSCVSVIVDSEPSDDRYSIIKLNISWPVKYAPDEW